MVSLKRRVLLTLLVVVAGCRPELEDDAAVVSSPRVLAVRSEPAEAKPNEKVSLVALYTDGSRVASVPLGWSFCAARRALSEPGPIDPACLEGTANIAIASPAAATIPRDACRAFGPDRPLAKPGEPSGRPSDPDATGGFYQVGVVAGSAARPVMFETRIRCALPSVTQDVAAAYEQRYRANQNPEIARIVAREDHLVDVAAAGLNAAPGERVRVRVEWPETSAELFTVFDQETRALVDRRESLTVSWLASGGVSIPIARTATGENDITMPSAAGEATLFVVLRDSRGGVAFKDVRVTIR